MTTEEQLKIDAEAGIEKEWEMFVATTDFLEPLESQARFAAKAAFRVGYFAGMNFSTMTLAKNLRDVMKKLEQSGK
jgi:hypothetical protein